jgi:hypothetical protein
VEPIPSYIQEKKVTRWWGTVDRVEPIPSYILKKKKVTRWWGTVDRAEPVPSHERRGSDKVGWGTVDRGHVPSCIRERERKR